MSDLQVPTIRQTPSLRPSRSKRPGKKMMQRLSCPDRCASCAGISVLLLHVPECLCYLHDVDSTLLFAAAK